MNAEPKVPFHTETGRVHGPNWLQWLGHLVDKPDVVGLEVGTFKGESAEWFLENIFTHATAKYYCVDFFQGSVEHHMAKIDCSNLEGETRERLKPFPQVEIIRGYSHEVLRSFKTPLDFGYCDAAHDALNVLRDAVLIFDLLKIGGVMIFDDRLWEVLHDPLDSPKMAIDDFVKIYSRNIQIIEPVGWQLCLKKIA